MCRSCAIAHDTSTVHLVSLGCVVFAFIHQNIFLQRWHEIHAAMTRAPPTQVHDSINSPPLIAITHQFSTPQTISPSRGRQPILILAPTQHTILVVEALLDTANSSLSDTSVHLYRPIIPLKIKHLIMLRQCMNITNHRHISHRVIYHRLFISAQSPLIPHK